MLRIHNSVEEKTTPTERDPFRTHFGPISPHFGASFFQVRAARGARFWLQDWLCVQWHAGARDEPDWWIPSWLLRHCQTSRRRQTPSFRLKKFRRWNRWIKSEVMYPDECSHGSNWNTMRLGLSHYSLYIYIYIWWPFQTLYCSGIMFDMFVMVTAMPGFWQIPIRFAWADISWNFTPLRYCTMQSHFWGVICISSAISLT